MPCFMISTTTFAAEYTSSKVQIPTLKGSFGANLTVAVDTNAQVYLREWAVVTTYPPQ